MTPAEQSALQGLAGRPLTDAEMAALPALVAARNDVAVAALLSTGRKRIVSRLITARGVRAALTVPEAFLFLTLLKATAGATIVPTWLADVLTAAGVADANHAAYLDMFACAHDWLQGAGLDLGDATTRAGLALIAESDHATFGGIVAKLLALAEVADPLPLGGVSFALNVAAGHIDLGDGTTFIPGGEQ